MNSQPVLSVESPCAPWFSWAEPTDICLLPVTPTYSSFVGWSPSFGWRPALWAWSSLSFSPSAPRTASQALEGEKLKVFHTHKFSHQEMPFKAEDVSQGRRGYGPGGMVNQGAGGGGWKSRAGTKPQEAYCFEKGMGGLSSASSTLVLLFPDQQKSICRG